MPYHVGYPENLSRYFSVWNRLCDTGKVVVENSKKAVAVLVEFDTMRGRLDLMNVVSANLQLLSLMPAFHGKFDKALRAFTARKSLYYFVTTFTSQNPKSPFDVNKLILLLGGLCYTGGYFHKIGVYNVPLFTRASVFIGSIPLLNWNGNTIRLAQAPLLNLIANSPGEFFFCIGAIKQSYHWMTATFDAWLNKNENEENVKFFQKQIQWDSLCLLTANVGRAMVFGHFFSNKVAIIFINAIRNNAAFAVSLAKKW